MNTKSCNASKFDERRKNTHRNHHSEYVGPETSKLVPQKMSRNKEDRVAKTEHFRGYFGAKKNTALNISQNKENTWIRNRNGSFQLQGHDNYHKSPHASKSFTAEKLVKVSQATIMKRNDLKLPYKNTKAYNHSRKADYSISEDWDEECQSFKSKETVSLPGSSFNSLDIKQNKCTLNPSHAALISAYQDLIQIPSEHSSKSSPLGVNKKEFILKSGFQSKDFEGKKCTSEPSKDSSHKAIEAQVHLNTNSQHSHQDLKPDKNTNSLTKFKYFHNNSLGSDRQKISEEDNNDVLNNSQLSIANVNSDPIDVCTYNTSSDVSSDLEAEICSQSDEGEFMHPHEFGGVKVNCKRKKVIKHPEHCHQIIQESPESSTGFPIESLSLPASSFGSKESLEKVINFMRSCAVKMFEFISSRQHLALNALITVSIPDTTHNNSTSCSVDKLYPHCCHEVFKTKVEESSFFHHLFPFHSMPYLIPPYWQWNYWPEWHSPPIVTSPNNREPYDYCTSDGTESLGHSHDAQMYHSLGLETGCSNNLHLQSDRSAMKNIDDDDLSTKASQSKVFGPDSLTPDLMSPSEHNVTEESISHSSAASPLTQTKNTQSAFVQSNKLLQKRTNFPTQQLKEKFSLTNANTCNSHVFNRNEYIPLHYKNTQSWQGVPMNSFDSSGPNANTFMPTQLPKDGYNLTDRHLNSHGPNANTFMPTQLPKDGYNLTDGHLNSPGPNANTFMPTQLPKDGYNLTDGHLNSPGPNANTFMPTQLPKDGYNLTDGNINSYGPNANTFMPTQYPMDGYNFTDGHLSSLGPNSNTFMTTHLSKKRYSLTEGNFINSYGAYAFMPTPLQKEEYSLTEGKSNAYGPYANTFMPTQFPNDGYSLTGGNFNAYGPNANTFMPTQLPKDGYSMTEGNSNAYGPNTNTFMPTQLPKDGYSLTEGNSNAYGPNTNTFMPTQLPKDGYSLTEGNSNAYGPNTNTFMPTQLPKDGYSLTEGNSNAYGPKANTFIPTQLPLKRYRLTEGNFINSYGPSAFMQTQLPKKRCSLTERNSNANCQNANTFMPTQLPKDGYSLTEGNSNAYSPNANTFMPTQLPKDGYSLTEGNSNAYSPNANTFMPTQLPKDGYSLTEGNSNAYSPNANTFMPTQLPKDGYSLTEGNSNAYGLNANTFMPTQPSKDEYNLTEESMKNTSTQTAIMEPSRCKTDLEAVADEDKKSQGHLETSQGNVADLSTNSESDSLMLSGACGKKGSPCDTENTSEGNSDHPKQEQSEQHQKTDSAKTLQPGVTFKTHLKSRHRFGSNILRRPLHFHSFLPKMASSLVSRFKGSDSLHWRKDCKPLDALRPSPRDSPKHNLKTDVGSSVEKKKKIDTEPSSKQGTPSSQQGTTSRWKNWNFSPSYWSPPKSPSKSVEKQSQWTEEFISKSKTYKNTFIDSHCHLDFLYQRLNLENTPFKQFREENAHYFPANYEGCLAVFCNPKTFSEENPLSNMVNLLSDEEGVWFSFGCHPKNALEFKDGHEVGLRKILSHPKVVSLGEIGLDYSGNFIQNAEIQKSVFKRQLLIAVELKLPLVIHCRDADDDCLQILQEIVPRDHKIHAHCFTRNMEVAVRWLAAFPNLFIGLTPLISYKTAFDAANTASFIPLDRLLLETDAPYFVPRTKQRIDAKFSFPGFALFTAEKVAELKGLPVDLILKACRENTRKMYGI